jgi:uncharacterized protein YdeI (YjbR/CyaY-like superfamily)
VEFDVAPRQYPGKISTLDCDSHAIDTRGEGFVKARDEVVWFGKPVDWRAWLDEHHAAESEIWVGFRKKHVTVGITWQEAVDEALCFGWIDGLTHAVDADGYTSRFTPRTRTSIWSAVNLKRIEELIAAGRVHDAGMRTYTGRDKSRAGLYAFEQEEIAFPEDFLAPFRANEEAWAWFASRPPGYQRLATWWVISAKLPETRDRRLATLIDDCANEKTLKQYTRG